MHTGPKILAVPSDVSVGKPVCMFAVCTVTSTALASAAAVDGQGLFPVQHDVA